MESTLLLRLFKPLTFKRTTATYFKIHDMCSPFLFGLNLRDEYYTQQPTSLLGHRCFCISCGPCLCTHETCPKTTFSSGPIHREIKWNQMNWMFSLWGPGHAWPHKQKEDSVALTSHGSWIANISIQVFFESFLKSIPSGLCHPVGIWTDHEQISVLYRERDGSRSQGLRVATLRGYCRLKNGNVALLPFVIKRNDWPLLNVIDGRLLQPPLKFFKAGLRPCTLSLGWFPDRHVKYTPWTRDAFHLVCRVTVAQKICCIHQSHQSEGLCIVTKVQIWMKEAKMENITSKLVYPPKVDGVYSERARPSGLIWPRRIERLQNATSGSSNYAELRPFRAGQCAGERPSVKMLRQAGGRRRNVSLWWNELEMAAKHSVRSSPNINNTNSAFQRTHMCAIGTHGQDSNAQRIHTRTHASSLLRTCTNKAERGANCYLNSAAAQHSIAFSSGQMEATFLFFFLFFLVPI